jgi:DinB family protein
MSVFTNRSSTSVETANAYTAAVLELLGQRNPMEVLRTTESGLRRGIHGLSDEQVIKPEVKEKWSVRHVVQHLADSELVWGYRLRMILTHDRPQLAGYDQDLWADRLHYGVADVMEALQEFGGLRHANLRVLTRSSGDDLKRIGFHAERGEESVDHMIRLHAGHDLLHLRQIERIRRAITPAE